MAILLDVHGQMLEIDNGSVVKHYPAIMLEIYANGDDIIIDTAYTGSNGKARVLRADYTEFTGDNVSGSSASEVAENISELTGKATMDVAIQDQTTDAIITRFTQTTNQTTLNGAVSIEDKTITLTSATGAVDGKHVTLFDPTSIRFSLFNQIGAAAGNVITLDCPMDFAYPDGTFVDLGDTNMAVDGSVTPQVFGLRGVGTPPGVELSFDVTRIMIYMLTDTAVSLAEFGDIPALTNGVCFRKRDGRYKNIFNIKTNGDIAQMAYDINTYEATNPSFGQDGLSSRLTFGGQSKMGVVVRLDIGEDLEVIIQDDLTGIDFFSIVAEGHIVD